MSTSTTPPELGRETTATGRQFALWFVAALATLSLLAVVLRWQHRVPPRFAVVIAGDPVRGEQLFRSKNCAHCHAVNGAGAAVGPDLTGRTLTNPDGLLTAMWNHAPGMWERSQSEQIAFPSLSQDEIAHVSAYLSARGARAPETKPHP